MGSSRLCILFLSIFALSCAEDPPALVVDLRADLIPGVEFSSVRVILDDVRQTTEVTGDMDFLRGERVARFSGLEPGNVEGVIQLATPAFIVLERRFALEMRAGIQSLTIVMTRDCRGIECPGSGSALATACLAGQCVDPRCSAESPEYCAGAPTCATASDCAALDPCSDNRCDLSFCLYGDRGVCGEGMYCSPEAGCLGLPMSFDGGMFFDAGTPTDGGPSDVGTPDTSPGCATGGPLCSGTDLCLDDECFPEDSCTDTIGVPCERVVGSYLKASNTDSNDRFGVSVSISGDLVAIGANAERSAATTVNGDQADDSANGRGAVYIFRREAGTWVQEAYLKPSMAVTGFGTSVSLDGDRVAIGAPDGGVFVFVRSGTDWSEEAILLGSNTALGDSFGISVSLSGDALAVGAPAEDSPATGIGGVEGSDAATSSGAVYLFRRTDTTWAQEAYVKASNTDAFDQFGFSVSLDGGTLAVGAWGEDSASTRIDGNQADNTAFSSGAVYVFRRNLMVWSQQAYIKASNAVTEDQFGWSVSLNGGRLAVGANTRGLPGGVYVFDRMSGVWSETARLGPGAADPDEFGASVCLNGALLAVGSWKESSSSRDIGGDETNNSATGAGAVYLFELVGASWTRTAYLKATNTDAGDSFGLAVALGSTTLAVGALRESSSSSGVGGDQADNTANESGAVYTYRVAP